MDGEYKAIFLGYNYDKERCSGLLDLLQKCRYVASFKALADFMYFVIIVRGISG